MHKFKLTLLTSVFTTILTGCSVVEDESENLFTVEEINTILTEKTSLQFAGGSHLLTCDGDLQCYVSPTCNEQADYYSTKTVYGFDEEYLEAMAYTVTFESPDCTGDIDISSTNAGIWDISFYEMHTDSISGTLTMDKIYYDDGYVLSDIKPSFNVTYMSHYEVLNSGELCLSDGMIDDTRPLRALSTTPGEIDYDSCLIVLE